MADFVPPPGPPPPKVPAGWKAQWNDQYKEWFFVNIYTKHSQWEKPTEPVYPPDETGPSHPPPGYTGSGVSTGDRKSNPYDSRAPGSGGGSPSVDEDARLAAKLQAEEDARASNSRGNAMQDYASTPLPPQAYGTSSSQELPPREEKRGLFSKLLGGGRTSSQQQYRPQQAYGQPSYGGGYPQQSYSPGYGGGYPPQQPAYGGYPPQGGYGGGYGGGYQQQAAPARKTGGGLGTAGGAALGLGGGLLGGMVLGEMLENHDQNEYNQGYDQGQMNGDNGGGDYGGGDGGDMGGGDMGGGDMGGGGDF